MRITCALLCWLTILSSGFAHDTDDKRQLEHADYERWNSIRQRSLSNDGEWVMYSIRDGKDRSTLFIREAKTAREYKIPHASSGRFTADSTRAIYRVSPDPELVKKLTKEKKKDQIPKSRVVVLHLKSGNDRSTTGVSSYDMPQKNGDWLAMILEKEKDDDTTKDSKSSVTEVYEVTETGLQKAGGKKSKKAATEKPAKGKESKSESTESEKKPANKKSKKKKTNTGSTLVLRHLASGREQRFPHVTSFVFTENGERLAFATSTADKPEHDGVSVINLKDSSSEQVISGLGNYSRLSFSKDGSKLAFLSDRDDYEADKPSWSMYLLTGWSKTAERIAFAGDDGIPEKWWISSSGTPAFSDDNRRLYFNTQPIPEDLKEEKDKDADPVAKLDLWHWKDPVLQPEQLLRANRDRNRSYRAVYDLSAKKIMQLATKHVPQVSPDPRSSANVALGTSDEKYRVSLSWDRPGFSDFYLVDLKTGERKLVVDRIRASARMSPEGKFITWWDYDKRGYFAMSTDTQDVVEISKGIETSLFNELHDTPSPPSPYGTAGWLENDRAVLVYDRFDIWQVDPHGKKAPKCVTQNYGRTEKTRLRYVRLDSEARAIDPDKSFMLSAFNESTKASGYFQLKNLVDDSAPEKLIQLNESVSGLARAKDSNAIVFSRSTFKMSPDVWYSTTDFEKVRRISRSNPQQHEYKWGSVELVKWNSSDDKPLDGLLYKPDGFDPSKKYPLLVYFYERNSDNLHRYYRPEAGRSIINFSFYVSRGYVLFVPDIPYTDGFPGDSAVKAVLPGVESILAHGYIDKKRVGMQGHSWGGYQTAYLVTQTDMFACAESGAPVSNMTSAYGGIRWGSGLSRMFQYERTQSRIGKTLWEGRELYIKNSPLFHADKINTPLLILHNDEDGAVPWYQGIEMFVALRRLSKPAWLMNYNGEPHWVLKKENRLDFAKRMQQFFDHYLMGEPMPEWMATGIPAINKGKKFGFEPAKEQPAPENTEEKKEEPASNEAKKEETPEEVELEPAG